ncbi:MAG: hypothetical protein Q8K89_11415, partial [Actinomycetota bacterium]|nr:hypothetical protein [Actinomycetota bacterium]
LTVYMPESLVEQRVDQFSPGTFYKSTTPYSYVKLKGELTSEVRDSHNRVGELQNENFIVRLWALLESHGFTKPIRSAAHSKDIRLLKELRQHYAHGTGYFNPEKRRHISLRRKVGRHFGLSDDELGPGIPTTITTVLEPLYLASREYALAVIGLAGLGDDTLESPANSGD